MYSITAKRSKQMNVSLSIFRLFKLHWCVVLIIHILQCTAERPLPVSSSGCVDQSDIKTLYGPRPCFNTTDNHEDFGSDVDSFWNLFDIKQAKIGIEIRGMNLSAPLSEDIISQIREAVLKHKILIVKDQGVVSVQRQLEITGWFGELECIGCFHPQSPHPLVQRLSNNGKLGNPYVGLSGWHVDGAYQAIPQAYSIYHIINVPTMGDTVFVDLNAMLDSVSAETLEKWDRLSVLIEILKPYVHNPLLYRHPITKQHTLCFHLGTIRTFVWDNGTDIQRTTNEVETRQIKEDILYEIVKDDQRLVYSHKWEAGDFIISDNLAVAHKATPATQFPVSEIGLRVLHRTTVRGLHRPQK